MGTDKRKLKRFPFSQQIIINNSIMVNAVDISKGGLYAHTGRMFSIGSTVNIAIPINSHHRININARVQHCQEGVGMGLEFAALTSGQQDELKTLLLLLERKKSATSKKRILIVDSNELARRMNKSRLILDGFSVLEAKNDVEAIEILESESVDVVILDPYMNMVQMDGFKLMTFIKQMPQHKDVPIVVLTARSTPDIIEQAMSAGARMSLGRLTTSPVKLSMTVKDLLKKNL